MLQDGIRRKRTVGSLALKRVRIFAEDVEALARFAIGDLVGEPVLPGRWK